MRAESKICYVAGFEDGAISQGIWVVLKSWKSMEMLWTPLPQTRMYPGQYLHFNLVETHAGLLSYRTVSQ